MAISGKRSIWAVGTVLLTGLCVPAPAQFRYWDVGDIAQTPVTLSATGLYADIAATPYTRKKLIAGAYHYEVNSPLWSDDAHKLRWVMVKNGASIGFDEKNDYWKYPDSTVFIKQFALDTVPGDSTSRVLWETRLLLNKKEVADSTATPPLVMDRWYGFSYKWNADQKDAKLVDKAGVDDAIRTWPKGRNVLPFVMKKWRFPSRSECVRCHQSYSDTVQGRSVLGFFTAQLNRPHPDTANINQLEFFFKKGLLTGTKPANWATSPKWAAIDDNTASLDLRARSYIGANCSGCHGRRGMANGAPGEVSLNYDFFTMEAQMEFRYRIVSWPFGLDDSTVLPRFYPKSDLIANPCGEDSLPIEPALVVPGYPGKSVILFRQLSRDTIPGDYDPNRNQMPPLASFEVNVPATTLLAQWIASMTPAKAPNACATRTAIRADGIRTLLKSPILEGRTLRLPPELAGSGNVKVSLTGITGRCVDLAQTGRGAYAIPSNLSPGVYLIRVGNRSFARFLF